MPELTLELVAAMKASADDTTENAVCELAEAMLMLQAIAKAKGEVRIGHALLEWSVMCDGGTLPYVAAPTLPAAICERYSKIGATDADRK